MRNGTEDIDTHSAPLSSRPPTQEHPEDPFRDIRIKVAYASIIGLPVLAALPPRKLDVYTFGMGIAWVLAVNEVTKDKFGAGAMKLLAAGAAERRLRQEKEGKLTHEQATAWKGEAVRRAKVDEDAGLSVAEMVAGRIKEVAPGGTEVLSVVEEIEKRRDERK